MNRDHTRTYRRVNLGEVAMPICVAASDGNFLIDVEGNRYLDFCSGSGVTNAGWNRKEVRDAVHEQLERLSYCAPWYPTREAIDLSELLLHVTPDHLVRAGRATGGADANELIFRAAYALTGKPATLTLGRAYHGGSRLTVNMSDAEAFRLPRCPLPQQCHSVAAPHRFSRPDGERLAEQTLADIRSALDAHDDIGLFLCEPILGSGGVIIPPDGFLHDVRTLCRERGIVFAMDEVITGFGRAGHLTLSEYWGLEPDAIALGKGMGGGIVPIGSAVMTEELARGVMSWEDVSPTFAWTPLACAAAAANIRLILDEDLSSRSRQTGARLLEAVTDLFEQHCPHLVGEIRGMGMMVGIELVNPTDQLPAYSVLRRLAVSLVRAGLMIKVSWDFRVLILMPPLNLSEHELEFALGILEGQVSTLV